jgi:Holliday junction DNA helicase RuvA
MIRMLSGTVCDIEPKSVVLDIGGVGYQVFVTTSTLSSVRLGSPATFFITHVVREDAQELFGFEDRDSRAIFELLQSVSGIGPRSALSILSGISLSSLKSAIASGDTAYLTTISGIGKKTAEKIILELKDKLGDADGLPAHDIDVYDALWSMGYQREQIRAVLGEIGKEIDSAEERIKEALKRISQG